MAEFVPPDMNGDHQEELRRFVARRKQEGGAPTDF
jgi:trimethylamine---corrinoid protein Co-methyltransferase